MSLAFHEFEACEGIVQYLERRERAVRSELTVQDKDPGTSPDARVEMTLRLAGSLYAIEHTGIEPFDGFMAHQNRARDLFQPIEIAAIRELGSTLINGTVIELHLPIDALTGRKMAEVRAIQAALVNWIAATAPTLTPRKYADYRGTLHTAQPDGVPFSVSLIRFDGVASLPARFQIKHLAGTQSHALRAERVARACDKKFPKLARWKELHNARTILVLEDNDMQLTNPSIVAQTYLPIAAERPDRPDETYMVSTFTSSWFAWPLLIDERTFFDLAEANHPMPFEIDSAGNFLKLDARVP